MTMQATKPKTPRGRPPKFREPRRPVTVTLPDRTLAQLQEIDADRARAIVLAAEHAAQSRIPGAGVTVVEVTPGSGLIVVGPCRALRRIPFLRLVKVAPFRFILALVDHATPERLEIALHDTLEDLPAGDAEGDTLRTLLGKLASLRRGRSVERAEILIVRLR